MKIPGFHCRTCGQWHDELPMAYGASAPDPYRAMSEDERSTRAKLSEEQCVIDSERFFIRGNLEVPVVDGPAPLVWGVWVSLSRQNFERVASLWNTPGRESEPPYFGWLCTFIPIYPSTFGLKTNVHTSAVGQQPTVELEPTDHPLAVEQRTGITMDRVREIAAVVMHGSASA